MILIPRIAVVFIALTLFFSGFGLNPFLAPPVAAGLEAEGVWDGLEQLQVANSQYSSTSLKKRINNLSDHAQDSLPIPVLFGVSPADLAENFGDARGGGRTHEGLDIMVPKGAPIVSPTVAVVLSVGTGASSGNTVSTANPGGETFIYMHLDRIANLDKGDLIEAGDLIGYAGNTGNASGGAAHLHFEIRLGGATDPYPRLTDEFSREDKIDFATAILGESEDESEMAQFFADNYPDQFALAQAEGIDVPEAIANALGNLAQDSAGGKTTVIATGSSGNAVKTLQAYLISQGKGPAAKTLANTGATGYFGALTYAALVEYQAFAGVAESGTYNVPSGDNFFANLAPKRVAGAATGKTAAKTATIKELKATITALQAQILVLQQQLKNMVATPAVPVITVEVAIENVSTNIPAGNSINIKPGDKLKYQISVANSGTAVAEDIILRNNFPVGIASWDNVLVEGNTALGEIDKELQIGSISPGQKKIITCTARVVQISQDSLTNIAVAYNDDVWGRATAQVAGEL